MTKIFVSTREGTPKAYSADQVRAMWRRGEFTPEMLYWRQGMADWQPLQEFIEAQEKEDEEEESEDEFVKDDTPSRPAGKYQWTRYAAGNTAHVRLMFWLSAAVSLVAAVTDVMQWQLLTGGQPGAEALAQNAQRQSFIGMLNLVVTLTTNISFLVWVFRASHNCRGFGATNMRFTPGWSVAYFLLPLVNLIAPFFILREIWQVSRDPRDWQAQGTPPMLRWWLTWHLAFNLVTVVVAMLQLPYLNTPVPPQMALTITAWSFLAHMLRVPLSLVSHLYVTRVYFHQTRLVEGEAAVRPAEREE